jgi:hypothetical protein
MARRIIRCVVASGGRGIPAPRPLRIKGTGGLPRQASHALPEWTFLGNKVGLNLHNMLNIWQFLYHRKQEATASDADGREF